MDAMFTQASDSSPQQSGQPAGACGECGAPYARDQRYCLHCGAPLAGSGTTVAFAPLGTEPSSPPSSPPPHLLAGAPAASSAQAPGSHSAPTVIAGVGVLLLAMGVGVLIGRTGSSTPAASGTPQVLTVSTQSTSTTSSETTEAASNGSQSGKGKHNGKSGGGKEGNSSSEKAAPPSALSKLKESETSGNSSKYEQNSNHLPNKIET